MTISQDVLRKYEAMDEDELFEQLGFVLLGSGPGAAPEDRSEAGEHGRRWFRNRYSQLQRAICLNSGAPRKVNSAVDSLTAADILDLLPSEYSQSVHGAIIAALVVRMGLTSFCAGVTPQD